MHPDFTLRVTPRGDGHTAELRLLDGAESQVGYRAVDFDAFSPATKQGLFDLRDFVRIYAAQSGQVGRSADALVDGVGVTLARDVLGDQMFGVLSRSDTRRTLRVQFPIAAQNQLAAALARVPWEIARASEDEPTLAEKNLIVRAIVGSEPEPAPLVLEKDEALRVLFIFAEAPGSRPLAARQEREQLLALFEKEIYPHRRVEADVLAHGVTRERLKGLITDRRGFHVVHWSGHGHQNLLELAGGRLSGDDLVQLLSDAGGFNPQLFFLSACHSGDVLRIRDWAAFEAVAEGKDPRAAGEGYTGIAHELLRAGIPSVVAMRYSVGDDYARDLAVDFYRAIFAATNPVTVAEALNLARKHLREAELRDDSTTNYDPCDHATPVLYGRADPELPLPKGKSDYKTQRTRRLGVPIRELDIREHPHFVGRTWELAALGANFIGYQKSATVQPVALIQGIGGMGKTALAAEALDLWEKQFDWILLFQAKPNPLNFDNTLREIHNLLNAELKTYHRHVQDNPADAIWRRADDTFRGEQRLERLSRNLVRAMEDEAILLVLDNFETNLKEKPEPAKSSEPVWTCHDPAWDQLLELLAKELPATASRVLITCRRPLAALPANEQVRIVLGPLPAGEAALYLGSHPALRRLVLSEDAEERKLAHRLFAASRFHPLLLDRLTRLISGGETLRAQLEEALLALEKKESYAKLPELFATRTAGAADLRELAYLHDALESSIDLLLVHAGADARRLLWVLAVANEPVMDVTLRFVWGGHSVEFQRLLSYLTAVGLVTAEGPQYSCHELVRERILVWIDVHPDGRQERDEKSVRLRYAHFLAAVFHNSLHEDATTALEAGRRALVYCVQAEAYEQLAAFASSLITATHARLLNDLIPYLEQAVELAPAGESHWTCLSYLADAFNRIGRFDASISLYDEAANEARAAGRWTHVAAITGNWALALRNTGHLDASRAKQMESAEAAHRAQAPKVVVIAREVEAYRIDIMQGNALVVLPEIEQRLVQVESWWQRTRGGETMPEAPDEEFLARVLIGTLDVATEAHISGKQWKAALVRTDRILEVERELNRSASDIAMTEMNRAVILGKLGNYTQAQRGLEACLEIFRGIPEQSATVLSALANLFADQEDSHHAVTLERRALAMCNELDNPPRRAQSHHNLANYLDRISARTVVPEAASHRLAGLVYVLTTGMSTSRSLRNYAICFRQAKATPTPYPVPRLGDLLDDPAFRPLAEWLEQRQIDRDQLQARIDELLDEARRAAEP